MAQVPSADLAVAQRSQKRGGTGAMPAGALERPGLYVYCVAASGEEVALGVTGLEGSQVHSVAHDGLCAVVHRCPVRPYESADAGAVSAWVLAHHGVVEAAWKRWQAVLPLTFNTIIAPGDRGAPESLRAWLDTEHPSLQRKLEAVAGKAEYGVQVFWDTSLIARSVARSSAEIGRLEEEIRSKPRGIAYMYGQRLEALLKKEMEARAAQEVTELYHRLTRWAHSIHVGKAKPVDGERQMLVDFSCLARPENYPGLKAELDMIGSREGYSVRLTGPMPPYSFC